MLKVQVIGNLGADAEVKEYNGKKFVAFKVAHTDVRVADDGTKSEATFWVGCTINGDGGNLLQYLRKGVKVYVTGSASLRVYSSKKLRAMVAGCDIRVDTVELCGGQSDIVPKQVATGDGLLHEVRKLYWSDTISEAQTVYSANGEAFNCDQNGFITPFDESNTEQSTESDSETAG